MLPPSDPNAIHPALLNAVHLAACSTIGGSLLVHVPYLLRRTRESLQEALTYADRLTHFLWASITFGCWLGRFGYFKESAVISASTARFALGCGLVDSSEGLGILPPPVTVEEAADRIQVINQYILWTSDRI